MLNIEKKRENVIKTISLWAFGTSISLFTKFRVLRLHQQGRKINVVNGVIEHGTKRSYL